ncbi:phosphoenolpyruvate--protein phosphotransferase [Nocardiopsis sp. Huas11]|uniref:phosphoenolpyruvate--protein phosphotransferase n=1 Tax=Nocardiopsis sp. Huas11 TaxID=2183912 RepID=UPI000EB30F84|nr:putative PEP-binding protein [Nocardiopsis sp. Huas11]RKS05882.1 phosphoenolpyruvate--protein phosphotransferase [Nocardiopsis sp. Huas11]
MPQTGHPDIPTPRDAAREGASAEGPDHAAPSTGSAPAASASAAPTRLEGIPAAPGAAVGPVARMSAPPTLPETRPASAGAEAEADRARQALERVAEQFDARAEGLEEEAAAVLGALALMARDPELARRTAERTGQGDPAAWAVHAACGAYQELLLAAGGYLAERAADLADIRDRAVAHLLGLPMPGLPDPGRPHVLVADDLAPADTVQLDTEQVLAVVTLHGGPTSHTVILARSLGIPAVVGCRGADGLVDGTQVAVDGDTGRVDVDPDEERSASILLRARRRGELLAGSVGPGRTADRAPVALLLNVGEGDPDEAGAHDSEGVGLLRTEFLFLERSEPPTVAEQTAVYARLFRAFDGRTVTVRTLDAGSDKPLAFAGTGPEDNPALGRRGFRTARVHPELLTDQLAAIRAAADGSGARVRVMAPMVSTPAEASEFVALAREAGITEAGVMIEVPGAALLADRLLPRVDFVSIGTNDLAQYTMAADRTLGTMPDLLDPWQPALLELVGTVGGAGERSGRAVGVCGEAAADPLLAVVLVGLGATSLSMAAPALPAVRHALAHHTKAECRSLAGLALAAATAAEAREAVRAAASPDVADL